MRSPITRVVDLSRIEIPFSEWATTLYEATRKRAGSMSDLRFHSIFVLGNNDSTWALGQNLSREEYGDLRFELVTTLEEALERVGAV